MWLRMEWLKWCDKHWKGKNKYKICDSISYKQYLSIYNVGTEKTLYKEWLITGLQYLFLRLFI